MIMKKLLLLMTEVRVLFLFVPLIFSCSPDEKNSGNDKISTESIINRSLDAIGNKAIRDTIQNIIAFANCISPKGVYTTEIQTDSEGYSYFKQTYSYNPQPFEAIIHHKTQGFQIGKLADALSKEAVFAIRSHEFYDLILDVKQRFHDFSESEEIEVNKQPMYRIAAKDELNHLCLLFFDVHSDLLNEIHLQNPENEKELLIITFYDWKRVDALQLPTRVLINQSEKQYHFDFVKIQLNSPDFEKKASK
jgi:hypothetical protein